MESGYTQAFKENMDFFRGIYQNFCKGDAELFGCINFKIENERIILQFSDGKMAQEVLEFINEESVLIQKEVRIIVGGEELDSIPPPRKPTTGNRLILMSNTLQSPSPSIWINQFRQQARVLQQQGTLIVYQDNPEQGYSILDILPWRGIPEVLSDTIESQRNKPAAVVGSVIGRVRYQCLTALGPKSVNPPLSQLGYKFFWDKTPYMHWEFITHSFRLNETELATLTVQAPDKPEQFFYWRQKHPEAFEVVPIVD